MTDTAMLLQNAKTELASGSMVNAESICNNILKARPGEPGALGMLAEIARRRSDHPAARKFLSEAVKHAPWNAQLHFSLACCCQQLRDMPGSRTALGETVRLQPDHLQAWFALGLIQQENDESEDCIESFQNVLRIARNTGADPSLTVNAWQGIAMAEQKRGGSEAALSAYEAILAIRKNEDRAHAGRGWALQRLNRLDEAVDAFMKASEIAPGVVTYKTCAAMATMRGGDYRSAHPMLEEALRQDPADRQTLSALGVSLWERRQDSEYRKYFDYDRFVKVFDDTELPGEFQSWREFHETLEGEIRKNPSLRGNRVTNTTQHGLQTTDITRGADKAVAALTSIFNNAVRKYIADPGHRSEMPGFQWKADWRTLGWGVILSTQGHQLSHNHVKGMVSGVYYIKIPAEIGKGPGNAGFLEFGPPGDQFIARRDPPSFLVQPREGLLCLFPSHYWHRTIPFESGTERICIAFDAIPAH